MESRCGITSFTGINLRFALLFLLQGVFGQAQDYQYRPLEIAFTASEEYKNPFDPMEVDFRATFSGPEGSKIEVVGFWDGGAKWKIRFSPPTAGHWSFLTHCSNARDSGLHKLSGSYSVLPATGANPLHRHGGTIRVSQNKRHLTYQDGTPFFYLADTWWSAPSYTMPFIPSQNKAVPHGKTFAWAVNHRVSQGYTVLQLHGSKGMYADEERADHAATTFSKTDNEASSMDDAHTDIAYWQLYDSYIKYAYESGLVINLGVAATTLLDSQPLDLLKRHYRHLLARYGAYGIMWLITQEYNSPIGDVVARKEKIYALCEYLKELDSSGHLIGLHQYPVAPDHVDDSWSKPWNDLILDQNGHFHVPNPKDYLYIYFRQDAKPILESELNYEGFDNKSGFTIDSTMIRQSAYTAIQSGSAGYGYGASGSYSGAVNGIGQIPVWGPIYNWWDALLFEGGGEMKYLRQCYERVKWWKLEPVSGVPGNSRLLVKADSFETLLVWYPKDLSLAPGTTLAGTLPDGAIYHTNWFNPRDGTEITAATTSVSGSRLTLPEAPDNNDWMLILKHVDSGSASDSIP